MTTSSDSRPAGEDASVEAPSEWTPEQQIAHMLGLCEAQMESALAESDQAVDTLIKVFTNLGDTVRELRQLSAELPPELRERLEGKLGERIAAINNQIAAAVVAFQFYDKLTQRLGHVRYSLTSLAMFVCNRTQTTQRDQWQRLFSTLRRLYRTEEEREVFKLVLQGASADDARAHSEQQASKRAASNAGDIELF
jgi:molybdopterin converting factor small subunit